MDERELEFELRESVEGINFIDDPEHSFGTGLLFPERDEERMAASPHVVPMEELLGEDEPAYGKRFWANKTESLNQGRFGACTGFSGVNFLNTAPYQHDFGNDLGFYFYDLNTHRDPFPGYFNHETMVQVGGGGSTMKAMAETLVAEGYARTFGVTENLDTACRWLLNHGPILCGMRWGGCFRLDEGGYIHPDGSNGGHAIIFRGIARNAEHQVGPNRLRGKNQWDGWGLPGGEFRVRIDVGGNGLMRANPTFVCIAEESPR